MALAALGTLTEEAEARGAYAAAERYLQRCVALDPWLEEAHYQLMRVLALAGWRSAAHGPVYTLPEDSGRRSGH